MTREDFRIVKIERCDGYNTYTKFLVQRKFLLFWFIPVWGDLRVFHELANAEFQIEEELFHEEASKKKKTTKTIVG